MISNGLNENTNFSSEKVTLKDAIYSRRTIRRYDDNKDIDEETIVELIRSAVYAPSACNFQAWKFIIVEDIEQKRRIVKCKGSPIIMNSKKGILVVYRNDIYVTGRKHKDYVQSASASIQNILLRAYSLGLGACWICDLPSNRKMRKIFELPKNYDVIAYISLGYPKEEQENSPSQITYHYGDEESYKLRKRKFSIDQVISYDLFQSISGDSFETSYPKRHYLYHIKAKTLKAIGKFLKK